MKLLLGCVNSLVSLVGYDTETQESFWYCPGNILRVCGMSYLDDGLVVASDNTVTQITPNGLHMFNLPGPHDNLAHTVHAYDSYLGIADTGNSRLLLKGLNDNFLITYDPLSGWDDRPLDAIHLNDFITWKKGFLVSAFSYKPFHELKKDPVEWSAGGHGVIYYMYPSAGKTVSRIVASGLSCPHSLREHDGKIYCCSSKDGTFIELTEQPNGQLYESDRQVITQEHFLRGALRHKNGWYLGGSSIRRNEGSAMTLFDYSPEKRSTKPMFVAKAGEIYEILPWKDEIMESLLHVINDIPVTYEDGNTYPPKVLL